MRGKTEGIKQPSGWRTASDWNLHSKDKLPKNTHSFLLTGISQKTYPIKHDWENPPKVPTDIVYQCSYHRVRSSFPFSLQLFENNKIPTKKLNQGTFPSQLTDTDRFTLHSINTSSCMSFTFWWSLGCKHSLLLSFGGWIHARGRRVVVGWSIVNIRPSSANVHTWKHRQDRRC